MWVVDLVCGAEGGRGRRRTKEQRARSWLFKASLWIGEKKGDSGWGGEEWRSCCVVSQGGAWWD
eukprot:17922-Eustigmatos_ZCMA.PRE.1